MRRSLAKFSESEASNHTPSLADFTTTTPDLKFSVHTSQTRALSRRDTRRFNTLYEIRCSTLLVSPESSCLCRLNSIEPPWYGPVCPVVWEGWRRETPPYPDLWHFSDMSHSLGDVRSSGVKRTSFGTAPKSENDP